MIATFKNIGYIYGVENNPKNLLGLNLTQLENFALSLGEKEFRGRQLYRAIYHRREWDFTNMTDLALAFRSRLKTVASIFCPQIVDVVESSDNHTRKYLFRLEDGERIESVLMRENDRTILCISSQVGCALGCKFCATGLMDFRRNLTTGEIVGQVLAVQRATSTRLTNIVLMGMGEPLLNYDNVAEALILLTDGNGIAVSARRITLSTVGIIPGIERMTEDRLPCKLALSLNAPNQEMRQKLIPIARKYPLKELFAALRRYERSTRHRITFEYVLIKGVNDSPISAKELKRLLNGFTAKLNLIAYNPMPDMSGVGGREIDFKRPSPETLEAFRRELERPGLTVMLRKSRGLDIAAACGQLCLKKLPVNFEYLT